MARVPFLMPEDAPPEVRAIYEKQKQAAGKTMTTTMVRGHCPELLKGITGMQAAVEASDCAPKALKPLITLLVSRLNQCPH